MFIDCICSNIVFLAGSLAPRSRRQTRRQDEEKVIVFLPLKLWSRSRMNPFSLFFGVGYISQGLQRLLSCIRFRIFVSSDLAFVSNVRYMVKKQICLRRKGKGLLSITWSQLAQMLECRLKGIFCKELYLYLICTRLPVNWEAYLLVGEDICTCSIGTSMCTCSNVFKTVTWKTVRISTCTWSVLAQLSPEKHIRWLVRILVAPREPDASCRLDRIGTGWNHTLL